MSRSKRKTLLKITVTVIVMFALIGVLRKVVPIVSVLGEYKKIKVGTTRQEIETFLKANGGISNQFEPVSVNYVFKRNYSVHVRVGYDVKTIVTPDELRKLAGQKEYWEHFKGYPDDKVKSVSLPYIAPYEID